MAIQLLDMRATWSKIKAGFSGGKLFRNPPAQKSYNYVPGREAITEEAQHTSGMPIKGSVFGGKTFSQRK